MCCKTGVTGLNVCAYEGSLLVCFIFSVSLFSQESSAVKEDVKSIK